MTRAARLLSVALAMTLVLAGLVARHAWLRANGTEVRLDMEPVDPRDLLLGHYVIVRTPAHRIDTAELAGPTEGWEQGQRVYVALEPGADGGWTPVAALRERPQDGTFLLGRAHWTGTLWDYEDAPNDPDAVEEGGPQTRRERIDETARDQLFVTYNIERYYASEAEALALEAMRDEDRLRVIVSLAEDGSAIVKGLEIDGETRYDRLW